MGKTTKEGYDRPLPRGHAYVRMRNKGRYINVDFDAVSDEIAERMIEAAMKVFREAHELQEPRME